MSVAAKGIFIVGAKRTAFGTFGGVFRNTTATELQTAATVAALKEAGVAPEKVDSVVVGQVMTDILTGAAKISVAGGVENMSQAPFAVRNVRFGTALGSTYAFEDTLWAGLTDSYCGLPMGMTAEKLGAQFGITRDEVDNFALRSQQRWKAAQDAGVFKAEITPVTLTVKRKEGISDGAGAIVLAGEEAAKGLKPLARLVGWSYVGVDPSIMGVGPVPAIENLLKATKMSLNDIDLIEINEAFCAQTLSCAKALKLDMEKLNVNGGATALGHPLGASGSRIYIVAAKRTPYGMYGGLLRDTLAEDLFATSAAAALKASGMAADLVDTVNVGQVMSVTQSGLSGRHAALKSGIPATRPVLTINKLSGSGFAAIICSAQEILIGSAKISLAGGMESLSSVPFLVRGVRFGTQLRKAIQFEDHYQKCLFDTYCKMYLIQTADKGNADGGGAVILTDEESLKVHELKPLARLVGWSSVALDPLHETFAAATVACIRELDVDDDKLNLNGGAIAIGHPPAATGARIVTNLTHELR
ncbi:hypothetical protein HF086_003570 [Spodoptera exigua]|uniref:Uncharacterized protein n=1 Tax=Spodoptera exigua TaxID=7107 RepID=A0A922MME5_SPOEX|nr:hypothetical protein HF086_003570 [Spodoptera exigua]